MRIFAGKLKIINNEITNQREEGMKIRIATITFMLLTMSIQLWCGNHKFKSDYIDSLHTDVENHIYDKDVTKRIDKLMKASKEVQDDRGIAMAYKQSIFVTALWQGQPDKAQSMLKDMYRDVKDKKKQELSFINAYKYVIYGFQDLGRNHSAIATAKEMANNIISPKVFTIAHFAIYECYRDMRLRDMEFKELSLLIKNIEKGNNYMAASIYTYAALSYIDDNRQYDVQALSCLVKADSISAANKGKTNDTMRDFQENFLWYTYAYYHLKAKKGNIDKAHYYMSLLEKDKTEDSRRLLYALRMVENMNAGRWKEALIASDSLVKIKQEMDIMPYTETHYYDMAVIYKGLHNYPKALEYMEKFKALNDSNRIRQSLTNSEEMSELLNVKQYEYENMRLENVIKDKKLLTAYIIIGLILVVLILLILVIVQQVRASRQLRDANATITKAYQKTEHALAVKNSFIKSIKHEIRTPLNGIVGFSQVLTSMLDDKEEYKQMTDVIIDKSNQLTKIIDDVLYASDIQNIPVNLESVNIGDVIVDVSANYRGLLPKDGEMIVTPDSSDIMATTDRTLLAKALTLVVDNAVKFAGNSLITIAARQDDSHTEITVSDCGKGIPKDKSEWVFEEFTKVDDFTQGTGLGLAICREVMKRLNGSICIDTNYTCGCRMVINLPLTPGQGTGT